MNAEFVPLRRISLLNPSVPEFDSLPPDAQVTFAPLEVVWADQRLDLSRTRPLAEVRTGYTRFQQDDVLIPKVTPTHQAGRSAIARPLPNGVGAGTTELHILRAITGLADPRWLRYAALSKRFLEEGEAAFQGVAGLQRVPGEFVQDFQVADLPVDQQRRVADFLDDQVTRIDNIITARKQQMDDLRALKASRSSEWLPVQSDGLVAAASAASLSRLKDQLPRDWVVRPLWSMFVRKKVLGFVNEQMLSVFRDHGVVLKSSRENLNKTAEDRSIYQLVEPGWLVINRMKAWQGSVGVSPLRGIVSGHYICFEPSHEESHPFLNLLFRSPQYAGLFSALSRGVRPGQIEIDNDYLRLVPVILPPRDEQRRISDSLTESSRETDQMIASIDTLITCLDELKRSLITSAVSGEFDVSSADGSGVAV